MTKRKRDDARHQRQSEATLRIMAHNPDVWGTPRQVERLWCRHYRNLKPTFSRKEYMPSAKNN